MIDWTVNSAQMYWQEQKYTMSSAINKISRNPELFKITYTRACDNIRHTIFLFLDWFKIETNKSKEKHLSLHIKCHQLSVICLFSSDCVFVMMAAMPLPGSLNSDYLCPNCFSPHLGKHTERRKHCLQKWSIGTACQCLQQLIAEDSFSSKRSVISSTDVMKAFLFPDTDFFALTWIVADSQWKMLPEEKHLSNIFKALAKLHSS